MQADETEFEPTGVVVLKFCALLLLALGLGFSIYNFLQPPEAIPGFIAHPLVYLFGP